mmetsp:Transcript_6773/g.10896  ORF Transcript_6773/g.10896 Transcript_6773/m.10896 type:complete len:163 (-) Transcript_6773:29-517(-)
MIYAVLAKNFEVMRWELYLKIKNMTEERKKNTKFNFYLTKNELKNVMNSLDLWEIRLQVFRLFGIPVPMPDIDPPHEILMRAHYTYIIDQDFDQSIRELKHEHERQLGMLIENVNSMTKLEDIYSSDRRFDAIEEEGQEEGEDAKFHPLDVKRVIEIEFREH